MYSLNDVLLEILPKVVGETFDSKKEIKKFINLLINIHCRRYPYYCEGEFYISKLCKKDHEDFGADKCLEGIGFNGKVAEVSVHLKYQLDSGDNYGGRYVVSYFTITQLEN